MVFGSASTVAWYFFCGWVDGFRREGFKEIVDFSGTFFSAFVNLMVPSLLFLAALRQNEQHSAGGGLREKPWSRVFCFCSGGGALVG